MMILVRHILTEDRQDPSRGGRAGHQRRNGRGGHGPGVHVVDCDDNVAWEDDAFEWTVGTNLVNNRTF
jgi:hypothetical protein